jgi:hypothetical protein
MENHHFQWVNQLQMAIFNSFLYVYQRVDILGTGFPMAFPPLFGAVYPKVLGFTRGCGTA